jgi:peptidoglycan/LPS O-acetylase OafA/YrhL
MGVFFFSFIFCTMCFGIIIEYSTLFDLNELEPDTPLEHRKTQTGQFFLAFSITRNVNKIFNSPSPAKDSSLEILDGIKVLSLLWVIMSHGYSLIILGPIANFTEINIFLKPWLMGIVQGGVYAVDVLFFISAFLATYLILLKSGFGQPGLYKGINFFMLYFQKFYRLFPPMCLYIIFIMAFYKHLGEGPVWNALAQKDVDACNRNWWSHFLFIGNIYPWNDVNR